MVLVTRLVHVEQRPLLVIRHKFGWEGGQMGGRGDARQMNVVQVAVGRINDCGFLVGRGDVAVAGDCD